MDHTFKYKKIKLSEPEPEPDKIDDKPEDKDGQISDGPNPFLVEPILKVLMQYLSVADVKNLRLVSSLWNKCAQDRLEEVSSRFNDLIKRINVDDEVKLVQLFLRTENRRIYTRFNLNMNLYSSIMVKDPEMNILQHFRITDLNMDFVDLKVIPWSHLLKIFASISKTVRSLGITNIISCQNTEGGRIDQEFTKLEKLMINTQSRNYHPLESYTNLIGQVLKNSPKLRALYIDRFPGRREIFKMLSESDTFAQLTELQVDIWCFVSVDSSSRCDNKLSSPRMFDPFNKLKLKKLQVDQVALNEVECLNHFLSTQSSSLECLIINVLVYGFTSNTIQFDVYDKLTELTLKVNPFRSVDTWRNIFKPFSLKDKFPQLVKLEVTEICAFIQTLTEGSETLESLKMLENNYLGSSELKEISEFFPNIKSYAGLNLDYGPTMPWIDSLEELVIKICQKEDFRKIKIDHLKALKTIKIEDWGLFRYHLSYCEQVYQEYIDILQSFTNNLKLVNLNKIHFSFKGFSNPDLKQLVLSKISKKYEEIETKRRVIVD